jgi:signal transduction histidine kinase
MNEIAEIVSDIRRDDQRASGVIVRLRSLLKKRPYEASNLDLNEVVGEAVQLLSGLVVARQVELHSLLCSAPLPIEGDRVQLQQVVLNLVVNAMDAMSAVPPAERRVTVETARQSEFAEISVRDTGPGIQAEDLKKVFEPFYSTKEQGMGMGLSIARTIIDAHSGRITVHNHAGTGALFRVTLPLGRAGLLSKGAAAQAAAQG